MHGAGGPSRAIIIWVWRKILGRVSKSGVLLRGVHICRQVRAERIGRNLDGIDWIGCEFRSGINEQTRVRDVKCLRIGAKTAGKPVRRIIEFVEVVSASRTGSQRGLLARHKKNAGGAGIALRRWRDGNGARHRREDCSSIRDQLNKIGGVGCYLRGC